MKQTLALILLAAFTALYAEMGPSYKGVRAMGMGNAVTAVVDDRYALYNNPAGLNLFDGHFEFSTSLPFFINGNVKDLIDFVMGHKENLGNPDKLDRSTIEASYKIDGVWTTVGLSPEVSFMAPFMGAGAYITFPPHLTYESGPLIPKLGMGGVSDFVMMAGTSRRFLRTLSLGLSTKYVYRYYMEDKFLTYTETKGMAKKLQSSTTSALTAFEELVKPTHGVGMDVGALYHFGLFRVGVSIQDFPTIIGGELMTPQFNIGTAYKIAPLMELPFIDDMTAAVDFRNLIAYGNFFSKVHMGLETRMKNADLRFGINQGYPTFGVGFSYFFMTLNYVYYTEELGAYPGQNPLSTHLVELHLGFNL